MMPKGRGRGVRRGRYARRSVLASAVGVVTAVTLGGTLVTGGSVAAIPLPLPLGVMTFNIRTANGRDGSNAWPHRKGLVASTIARFTPDVAGLQEALGEQVEFLATALPGYRWLGIDRGLNGGVGLSEYTPIFYRADELSPIESGNFWLTGTPDVPPEPTEWRGRRRRMGRIVTWARFHHRSSGREFYVYNTHLTLRQGSRQAASAALIASRVARRAAGTPVVVLGDFNAPAERSDTWDLLTDGVSDPLRDAWVEAQSRTGPAFTLSEFGPPIDWDVGRIDWILVGGPVVVRSVETVVHSEAGRYPSDHYPVAARLEID